MRIFLPTAAGHTRSSVLVTDVTSRGCTVLSGTLHDPCTETTIPFHQGAPAVQIDHVVALEDAWPTGAQELDLQTRQNFANDPRNLQATNGPTNQKKGGRDAATGLPSTRTYHITRAPGGRTRETQRRSTRQSLTRWGPGRRPRKRLHRSQFAASPRDGMRLIQHRTQLRG
jgi:hypothetical protein